MEILLFVILAVIAGAALGWFIGTRPLAAAQQQAAAAEERFRNAIVDLASASERAKQADSLAEALNAERQERETLIRDLAGLRADQAARDEAFQERLVELQQAREQLSQQFGEIGNRLLQQAQTQFLERADERFRQSEEMSGKKLESLLQPVSDRLQRYEEGVGKVEAERREAYGNLTGLIDSMRTGQEAVRAEAAKLVNSLRAAPKARGRWGEQQLRNVLESCGLAEHSDFRAEVSVEAEDGRLRPDVIVNVPGGKSLVIDAKVSLNAYQDAYGAEDEQQRALFLAAHAAAMKAHINSLGNKAYWSQFPDAPDYVIMFVPGEHFLSAALENDPNLWDFAFEKRVLLATPTNLIAIARTVAAVWRQEKLARDAQQIGLLGKELYDRLAKASEHLKGMGRGLNSAVGKYNEFVSSFESRVLSTGRRFRELNVDVGAKEIEELVTVDTLPRYGQTADGEATALPILTPEDSRVDAEDAVD